MLQHSKRKRYRSKEALSDGGRAAYSESEEFVQSESQVYPEGSRFARTRSKVRVHTYVSPFVSRQGAPPLFEAYSAQPPFSLFQPLRAPSFQARIIAITMNSSSYYASVAPPRKWRPRCILPCNEDVLRSAPSSFRSGACAPDTAKQAARQLA